MNLGEWCADLAKLVANSLTEYRSQANDAMELFAVDCAPWNGVIALAFLTMPELKAAPFLSEVAEMAAWKAYDFGAGLGSWQPLAFDLGSRMRAEYESAGERRSVVAGQFLRTCAVAVASEMVQAAFSTYRLGENFRITIRHPDTDEEYYPPKVP